MEYTYEVTFVDGSKVVFRGADNSLNYVFNANTFTFIDEENSSVYINLNNVITIKKTQRP